MNEASKQAILSAIRSLLMIAGTTLAARGVLSEENVQTLVGAVMTIIPVAWGVWDKYLSESKTKAREAVAVNVGIAVADRTAGATPPVPVEKAPAVIEAFKPVAVVPSVSTDTVATGLDITPASPMLPNEPTKGASWKG